MKMFSVLSDQFLFFLTVFLFSQLERPVAVTGSYCFPPFPRLFFTFSGHKLRFQFLVFAPVGGISGCLRFLGAQLHCRGAGCAPQGCFWLPGRVPRLAVPRLAGAFSVSISADIFFCSVIFPFQAGLRYGGSQHLPSLTQLPPGRHCS